MCGPAQTGLGWAAFSPASPNPTTQIPQEHPQRSIFQMRYQSCLLLCIRCSYGRIGIHGHLSRHDRLSRYCRLSRQSVAEVCDRLSNQCS